MKDLPFFDINKIGSLLDFYPEGAYIVNQQFDIVCVNTVLEKEYGSPKARKCFEYFHGRQEPCPWCQNDKVFAGQTVRWEWASPKNGQTYDLVDLPLAKEDGSILKLEIFHNITAHKEAEKALQESQKRMSDIIFSMADWIWEVDERGVYTYSSHRSIDIMGWAPEEIIGKTPFDFMPPQEAKRIKVIFSEIMAHQAPIKDMENWNLRKDGQMVCLLTNGVPVLDNDGKLKGYRGVDKDITARKVMEESLRSSEERFAAIFDNINIGISVMDVNHRILKVNNHIGRLFGRDPVSFEGKLCFCEFENRRLVCPHCPGTVVMQQKKSTVQIETKGIKPDGSYFYANIWAVPTYDQKGVCSGFIELVQDVTERKQLEAELQKRLKEMETFYKASMGREERILELKKEVESLKKKLQK